MLDRYKRISVRAASRAVIFLLLFSVAATAIAAPAKKEKPLVLGVFPIVSTVALFKRFAPLRDYLSKRLGRPVILKTARDFPTFVKRTAKREYDIVITAPHFALKESDAGRYHIRVSLVTYVQQLVIVHKNSRISDIRQLAGKNVSAPPKKALMTMMGVDMFNKAGLIGNRKPSYRAYTSHNAANEAVVAGDADGAIASSNIVKKAIRAGKPLKIIARGLKLPNMATMVASDLDKGLAETIVNAMIGMSATPAGKAALKRMSFPGYRAVSARDYEAVRPYLKQGSAKF